MGAEGRESIPTLAVLLVGNKRTASQEGVDTQPILTFRNWEQGLRKH